MCVRVLADEVRIRPPPLSSTTAPLCALWPTSRPFRELRQLPHHHVRAADVCVYLPLASTTALFSPSPQRVCDGGTSPHTFLVPVTFIFRHRFLRALTSYFPTPSPLLLRLLALRPLFFTSRVYYWHWDVVVHTSKYICMDAPPSMVVPGGGCALLHHFVFAGGSARRRQRSPPTQATGRVVAYHRATFYASTPLRYNSPTPDMSLLHDRNRVVSSSLSLSLWVISCVCWILFSSWEQVIVVLTTL